MIPTVSPLSPTHACSDCDLAGVWIALSEKPTPRILRKLASASAAAAAPVRRLLPPPPPDPAGGGDFRAPTHRRQPDLYGGEQKLPINH